jgi:hypothetical protein
MTPPPTNLLTRRFFLQDLALGLGGVAFGSLMQSSGYSKGAQAIGAEADPGSVLPHFAPRAKHVIFLFMAGGPSQLDLFDPKPALEKYEGQRVPDDVLRGAELPFIERDASLMASPFKFSRHGQSERCCRSCCRISAALPMTSLWCGRSIQMRLIMPRRNCC